MDFISEPTPQQNPSPTKVFVTEPTRNASLPPDIFFDETNSESCKKLRQVISQLEREREAEHQQLIDLRQQESITPRGLVGELRKDRKKKAATTNDALGGTTGSQKDSSRHAGKGARGKREMDQYLLESEKERKGLELENTRLREIITLRQECCQRREGVQSREIIRLKDTLDTMNTRVTNPEAMMSSLRSLTQDIQQGISKLQETIEEKAESDKVNLIRYYRSLMHNEREKLEERRQKNAAGAQDWIRKNQTLTADRDRALQDITILEQKNSQLESNNRTLIAMRKNQDQQRNVTVRKIATLKKDNKRLEEQAVRLSEQIAHVKGPSGGRGGGSPDGGGSSHSGQGHSRRRNNNNNNFNNTNSSSKLAQSKGLGPDAVETRYAETLSKARKMLDSIRGTLKKVRGAHIEYLQEHTELSIMIRQCIDDVRKDIARHSIAHYVMRVSDDSDPSGTHGLQRGLEGYSLNDRQHLLDVLQSRERVLLLLSEKIFPFRSPNVPTNIQSLPDTTAMMEGGGASYMDDLDDDEIHTAFDEGSQAAGTTAEIEMDKLWGKWKEWAQKM